MESVERGARGDAGVKTVMRKRAMQSISDCSQSSIKRGQPRDSATWQKKNTMCTCQDRDNDEIGCG